MSAFKAQEGGTWYSTLKVQPLDFIVDNELNWMEGNIVKYTVRHRLKHGAIDVKKIIHYAQMLLEKLYGIKSTIVYEENNKKEH